MNGEQLRYFQLAYQERSFSAAARRVPVSPQGMAKTIHNLEKELDVTLFHMDELTGLPAPTEYAHELFEFACVYDSNVRLLQESFDRIRGKEEEHIHLACSLGAIGTTGPRFISSFHDVHPQVHITYRENNDGQCDEALAAGDCGLALITTPPAPGHRTVPLFRSTWCFWAHLDHPLASRDVIGWDDLAGCDVAIPGEGYRCYDRLCRETTERSVPIGEIFQMSELFQIFDFALSGQGLGFCVEHLAAMSAFKNPNVKLLRMPTTIWGFDIVCLDTHALTEAEKKFWHWSVQFCKTIPGNVLYELDDPHALTARRPMA